MAECTVHEQGKRPVGMFLHAIGYADEILINGQIRIDGDSLAAGTLDAFRSDTYSILGPCRCYDVVTGPRETHCDGTSNAVACSSHECPRLRHGVPFV